MHLHAALRGTAWAVGTTCRRPILSSLVALLALVPAAAQDSTSADEEPDIAGEDPGATGEEPAVADEVREPTLEDLQRRVTELEEKNKKMPTTGSSDVTVKVFGRIHLDFWDFVNSDEGINVIESGSPGDDPLNTWEFRRARIGLKGDVYDNMNYKVSIDFGKPDGLVYKDMYIGFKDVPGIQELRIGNQKRPYGLDHLNSSRFNVFIERPFVIEAYNQDARRLGFQAYGVDADEDWNWRYGIFDMVDASQVGEIDSDTIQPEIAGRVANTYWWEKDGENYAHWALSGTLAFPDSDPAPGDAASQSRFRTRPEARSQSRWIDTGVIPNVNEYHLFGIEAVGNWGPTQLVGEWVNNWVDRSSGSPNLTFRGGYIYLSHFLTGEYMPWDRKSGTLGRPKPLGRMGESSSRGAWQVGLRYSYADFSDQEIQGGVGNSITLGLNWYWNSHASLQLNYINGRISERDDMVGAETFDGGRYNILGMRLRVDF